ncbi:unnamed protein product [Sphagnum jensenii]|uniref:Ferritin n=1 Tax=Sphagnum jensenii TaxID=128206 RepID=A0ABP1AI51_9BRYO
MAAQHMEKCPCIEEIKQEMEVIAKWKPGDMRRPLGRVQTANSEVDDNFNKCITFHQTAAALFTSTSAFFARDNVALPGVAFYFKILAQCEINDSWLVIDFLAKRGAVVQFGPVAAPPSDWVTSHQEFSEVTTAFSKNLALYKVAAKKCAETMALARKVNDVQAIVFLQKCMQQMDEKLRCASHYVAYLRTAEKDPHAMKTFDRRLPFEVEELAFAAGTEAAIQTRLMIGSTLRAECRETKKFECEPKDACDDLLARRTLNRVI